MIPLLEKLSRCLGGLTDRANVWGRKIDAVYTWVDGSDPAFRSSLALHRGEDPGASDPFVGGARRFQDNDELRYSLRSLETNAPWINNIFLVTNGQIPAWLRTDHPRLRMVTHETLFPDKADLPTFNTSAIETHLHRIPGLSRQYLYFNDDFFIGRPVRQEDFFAGHRKPRIFIESWRLPDSPEECGNIVHRFLAYNHRLLKVAFGGRDYAALPHMPMICDRDEMLKVEKLWRNEFRRTSSQRFRQEEMVLPFVLYAHRLSSANRCETPLVSPADFLFVMFEPPLEKTLAALQEIRRTKPRFFTINDDWDEPGEEIQTALREFFDDYFPGKSSFER